MTGMAPIDDAGLTIRGPEDAPIDDAGLMIRGPEDAPADDAGLTIRGPEDAPLEGPDEPIGWPGTPPMEADGSHAARRPTTVVKLGGSRLDDEDWLAAFAGAARRLTREARLCVVHGGGRDITRLLERLGIPSTWIGGRRVTSEADLEAVRMTLSGSVNKRVVRALRDRRVRAVGISGEDGALSARMVRDGTLGRVGTPDGVGVELLETLLGAGLVPVISPLARGEDGQGLNVNADEGAAAIAAALGADTLVFITDVPGILLEGRPIERVAARTLAALVERGAIHSGMLPKLSAAETAADLVPDVRIGDLPCLLDPTLGSRILASEAA